MKTSILFILIHLATHFCLAQTEIKLEEAAKHVGESVKVCGKVYGGKYLSNAKGTPTFLNMGAAFPNQLLTVVIWGDHRSIFPSAPEELYSQKEVCVTGKVELYRDKPQIVVKDTIQIQIR